jgi:membrane-bound metal-dependent hydrolase YbcI (DUF457 family)
MPNYRVHLIGGLTIFLITHYFMGPNRLIINFCCAMFGSVFPDLDTKSKVQIISYRLLGLFIIGLIFLHAWYKVLCLVPFLLFPLVIHHRGITHSFWFIALISAFISFFLPTIGTLGAINFFLGAISHILLDRIF